MVRSKQALLLTAHCGTGTVAPECWAYRGGNAATTPIRGIAPTGCVPSFDREEMAALDAATRERYMRA